MAIKRMWILIGSFLLGAPLRSATNPAKPTSGPNIQESTPDDDKAAMQQAASDADKWAAKQQNVAPTPKASADAASPTDKTDQSNPSAPAAESAKPNPASMPGVTATSNASAPAPTPAAPTPPLTSGGAKPVAPHRTGLNEMRGKLLSLSDDPQTFRLIVDGGYNVEFSYDEKSSVVNGGEPIKISELGYNDVLIVRYAGKDLYAVEVERVSKAPRPE